MTLLEQCRIWNKNQEYKNVIVAIEALEIKYRSPQLDCELACAYNNMGDENHIQYYKKAYSLLIKHEKLLGYDYTFNFRLAYSYYFLDEKTKAFYHFKKAYDERPGDQASSDFMMECMRQLSFPVFETSFEERVDQAWKTFFQEEEDLILQESSQAETRIREIFGKALLDLNLNVREKGEITFATNWDKTMLFKIQYIYSKMPEEVKENWVINIGKEALNREKLESLRVVDNKTGEKFGVSDFVFWLEDGDILLYSEKILGLLSQEEELAYDVTDELMINIFGELTILALEPKYSILREARKEAGRPLKSLIKAWEDAGRASNVAPLTYLNSSIRYDLVPDTSAEPVIRSDVYVGTTTCPALINEYSKTNFGDISPVVDSFNDNGIGVGYISYPLHFLKDKINFVNEIGAFNKSLMQAVVNVVGPKEVTFIGGATGLAKCYLDFISWGDMTRVLGALIDFFGNDEIFDVQFQCFRSGFPAMDIFAEENYV